MHSQCALIQLPLYYWQQASSKGFGHDDADVCPASLTTTNKQADVPKLFPSVDVRHVGIEKFTPDEVLLGVAGVFSMKFFALNLLVEQKFKLPKSCHHKKRQKDKHKAKHPVALECDEVFAQ